MPSTEELLQPRYKVIAIWPDMGNKKYFHGQIIKLEDFDSNGQYYIMTKKETLYDAFFDMYPHLFKKLAWYEERTLDELYSLKYAKVIIYTGYWRVGDIVPVTKCEVIDKNNVEYTLKYNHPVKANTIEPASEQQYLVTKRL